MAVSSKINSPSSLSAAHSYLQKGIAWRGAQLLFVVIIPTALAFFGAFQKTSLFVVPFIGFVSAVLDVTLFSSMIAAARYRAAQAICFHDASLISQLVPDAYRLDAPSGEELKAAARHVPLRSDSQVTLRYWQYDRVSLVRPPVAELLYYRTELIRDEHERTLYVNILLAIAILAFLALF